MGDASKVKDGKFGAKMDVELSNDGPVTMQIEYPAAMRLKTYAAMRPKTCCY